MSIGRATESASAVNQVAVRWRHAYWILLTVLPLEAIDAANQALSLAGEERLIAAMTSSGMLLLLGLATYGVCHRMRWGAWVAGVVAAVSVAIGATLLGMAVAGIKVQVSNRELTETPVSLFLGWLKVAAYLAFLVALVRIRKGRQSAKR